MVPKLWRRLSAEKLRCQKIRFKSRSLMENTILMEWSVTATSLLSLIKISIDGDVEVALLNTVAEKALLPRCDAEYLLTDHTAVHPRSPDDP